MPPKKRGRAKAPAKAKQRAKKQPAKQAAKKPARKAPKEDVRSDTCYVVTSKDSVKVKLNDAGDDGTFDTLGPIPALEYGCTDGEWYKDIGEGDGEFIVRHQSYCGMTFMSRQDAVGVAGERLIKRVKRFGPLVLQLPDDYINNHGDGMHPVARDMATTEPEKEPGLRGAMDRRDTIHEWTRTYTYEDVNGPCQCEAKFTTEVISTILMQPMGQADVDSSDDSGSDSESDC